MSETIISSVLSGALEPAVLLQWLSKPPGQEPEPCVLSGCSRGDFVISFLSFLRSQTDSILQTNTGALQVQGLTNTPDKLQSSRAHHRSISDPTYEAERSGEPSSAGRSHGSCTISPSREQKRPARRVKTKLFSEPEKTRESVSSDESRSFGVDRLGLSSTPVKNVNTSHPNMSLMSPVTPQSKSYERCDTPRGTRQPRSTEKSCLGDFIVTAQRSSKKKRSNKNVSDDSETKMDLDLSNSDMFPEIGARKSSSLRSEKRRIKPTNIDTSKKSLSLSSFNNESFQHSPIALEDNLAFRQQKLQPKELANSFDAERSILKQERQKLMEKFNSMSISTPSTPQIKGNQGKNFIEADASKISYKNKIDILVDIYEALFSNALLLSINTEIYFLISIVLSKQYEEDYKDVEAKFTEESVPLYILRTVHNSTYFAVRCLWLQRSILEYILDNSSLKLLGENKKVRGFSSDLAKCLLNWYGVRREESGAPGLRREEGGAPLVCFNAETDCADSFPSTVTFHSFKKQRDMFYEIVRWYEAARAAGAEPRAGLRARVRALAAAGAAAVCLQRLAALVVAHLLARLQEEDRVSKLTQRLTRPATGNADDDDFAPAELFYRDVVLSCEHFALRAHLRDALCAELLALDRQALPRSSPLEAEAAIVSMSRLCCALARLAALLEAQPYAGGCSLATRLYYQPALDIVSALDRASQTGRLVLTARWAAAHARVLAAYDSGALRLPARAALLQRLVRLYRRPPAKPPAAAATRWSLGRLFAHPEFPHRVFYAALDDPSEDVFDDIKCTTAEIDECDLSARSVRSLCGGAVLAGGLKGGATRRVTPLTMPLAARAEPRLDLELVRAAPPAARKVLDMVTDRLASHATKVLSRAKNDHPQNVSILALLVSARAEAHSRAGAALGALLPAGVSTRAFAAICARGVTQRLLTWTSQHWPQPPSVAELEAQLCASEPSCNGTISSPGPHNSPPSTAQTVSPPSDSSQAVAIAEHLINLKEAVACALAGEPVSAHGTVRALADSVAALLESQPSHPARHAAPWLALQLCLAIAAFQHRQPDDELLSAVEALFAASQPALRKTPSPPPALWPAPPQPPAADQDTATADDKEAELWAERAVMLGAVLGGAGGGWAALGGLLRALRARGTLRAAALAAAALALYRRDWTPEQTRGLATMVQAAGGAVGQCAQLLADYCAGPDFEPDL